MPRALGQVFAFLETQPFPAEVVVVENASSDRTLEVAQKFTANFPNLHVLHEAQAGKGRAVRRGVLEAHGDYRFIADADFSMPIEQVKNFIPPALDAELAIASREVKGAHRFNEPYIRHLSGRIFNLLIRLFILPGLQDTQCGFKCFRAAVAEDIFPYQTLTGWAFDVELLAIARRHRYVVREIGIPWTYQSHSKVNVLRDSWRMTLDLLTIRRNLRRGVYDART